MYDLRKWYFDLVTDEGFVYIVYWVEVVGRVGPVPLPRVTIASWLSSEPGSAPIERAARGQARPVERDAIVEFNFPRLDLTGRWTARSVGGPVVLLAGSGGTVTWTPRQLAGQSELTHGGRTISGDGYLERLETTIRPARLPMDRLRWGRFIGAERCASWIEWSGRSDEPVRRWLVVDGSPATPRVVDDDRVTGESAASGEGLSLTIDRVRVIHDRRISESLRGFGPLASVVISRRLRSAREAKWVARGTLSSPSGKLLDQGWVINERVDFGALARRAT